MINTLTQLKRDYVNIDPVDVPKFPVSFTPLKSNIDYLLNNYSNMIPETSREILSNNFTEYSIKYILNRAWLVYVMFCILLRILINLYFLL